MPDEVEFATKPVLAQRMLARALDAGAPAAWVTADEAWGGDSTFRHWLETRRITMSSRSPATRPFPPRQAPHGPMSWRHAHLRMRGNDAAAAMEPRGPGCSTGQLLLCLCMKTPRRRAGPVGRRCADR
ncbi:transposase [Amycolatopsis panacis]|uniref:transposase n=1 Tax=Amycolatopsis panacis TaxID=2340917 RepID=UPI003898EA6D